MATDFDAIVIGSGFGGAVAACRLAEAGLRVLILERGRDWKREEYPSVSKNNWLWDEQTPHERNGWLDFRFFKSIATVAGAGVGGGSLHYANVSIDASKDLFDEGWPPEISFQDLKGKYYPKVAAMLEVRRIPLNQYSNRTKLVEEAAQKAGFSHLYDTVDLAVRFNDQFAYDPSKKPDPKDSKPTKNKFDQEQGFCVHLGQCELGCPVDARNTLGFNYIPRARQAGAKVWPLHVARYVKPNGNGYLVRFNRIENGRLVAGVVTAGKVVVSAGSIGSTELLLRSRDQFKTLPNLSPMLGRRWASNANYLSFAFHDRDVYPSRGPTITAAIKFLGANSRNGQHFVIEDGGFPDLLEEYRASLLLPLGPAARFERDVRALHRETEAQPFKRLMPWFAQGRDKPTGTFRVKRPWWLFGNWGLTLDWDKEDARPVLDEIRAVHRILAVKTGGKIFLQLQDALITPHPLGGSPMGRNRDEGVVDHAGRAFGYPGLYVADGSIIPKPIGHNPSKTIAALSERIAEVIVGGG